MGFCNWKSISHRRSGTDRNAGDRNTRSTALCFAASRYLLLIATRSNGADRSEKRNAKAFCRLAEKCLTRSARRKRRVIIVVDHARIHTPQGSRLVAELLKKFRRRLRLRYVPSYSPECMPMEIFWNDWRNQVTHNHDRLKIKDLERDSDCYFARCARHPDDVLRKIGSPFAKHSQNRRN